MEQEIIFKSTAMKGIMKQDSITSQDLKYTTYRMEIDGENLDLSGDEYALFIEDLQALNGLFKEEDITKIKIKNMDLRDKPELSEALTEITHNADNVQIENTQFDNSETAFQQMFDKAMVLSSALATQQVISKFVYDKYTKQMTIDSQSAQLLDDYKRFVETKNLIVEVPSEEAKQDIINNIDVLREHRDGTIILRDTSENKNIEDLQKYESYANGNIVLFKSNILKETMGFDRLPTDDSTGVSYNLKIDGQKLVQEGMYKLDGEELEVFLNDLAEISKHCPLAGLNIKNIEIPEGKDLTKLSDALGKVYRINIENANIPNLKEVINGIEDKSKIETINIKDSGLAEADINREEFENVYTLSVKETQKEQQIENNEQYAQVASELSAPTIEVKLPWYKRAWDRVKQLPGIRNIFKNDIKALPEASKQNIAEVQEQPKQNAFIDGLKVSQEQIQQAKAELEQEQKQNEHEQER